MDGVAELPALAQGDLYDGPVITHAGGIGREAWVWVANGARPVADVFKWPTSNGRSGPKSRISVPVDVTRIDSFVEELRASHWEDEREGLWEEDEEVEDSQGLSELVVEALRPEPGERPATEIRILGPVEVSGWQRVPGRTIVTELACYLALHRDRPIAGDELRAALWPNDAREASAKSLRTYMSLLRKALGPEHVPSGSSGGYRVASSVATDWGRFKDLTGPGASPDQLRAALELVRGRPFAGVPSTSYGWVFSELLVSEIEVAVVDATRRLVADLVKMDALPAASWAVLQGLRAVPTDYGLWELRLSIAKRQGRDDLARARRDAEANLGSDVGMLFGQSDDA